MKRKMRIASFLSLYTRLKQNLDYDANLIDRVSRRWVGKVESHWRHIIKYEWTSLYRRLLANVEPKFLKQRQN